MYFLRVSKLPFGPTRYWHFCLLPCQGPFHGFHTTNCYLCFYTAPLTRLPDSVETAVCYLWFRNTLPARPCKSLALRLATIGSTGHACPHYVKPPKSQLLFATLVLQSPTCQALSNMFYRVGGTRASAHLFIYLFNICIIIYYLFTDIYGRIKQTSTASSNCPGSRTGSLVVEHVGAGLNPPTDPPQSLRRSSMRLVS